MSSGIGAAVAITALSACIAPWLDRQNNQNADNQESKATPEQSSRTVSQQQPDSLKTLLLNGLRKFTSVCLPSVDMTSSLQYFVSKPFVDIDINIISQSTQTDADSTYFTATEETRSTVSRESEKILQLSSPSSTSYSSAEALHQDRKILPKIQKPPRAHPPRKSVDAAAVVPSRILETPVATEISNNPEIEKSTPVQQSPRQSDAALTNQNNNHDPSSTMEPSECPKTFEVKAMVHRDPSAIADSKKHQENSRVSSATDHNNNSPFHDNYENNLNYVSSMGQTYSGPLSNIEESSGKNTSHHSSSFVTRIRVVLSRYFHFGENRSHDASGRSKGIFSKGQTESFGSSSRTGDTIINYPGKLSSCIVQDLNSENEKSKLSFSIAEVTSSTRIANEDVFDQIRFENTKNRVGYDLNEDKSEKFREILFGENFKNSRTVISNSETEYPTFETKRGIFKKLKGFFQRDKWRKLSLFSGSIGRETFDEKINENYYGSYVLCTKL